MEDFTDKFLFVIIDYSNEFSLNDILGFKNKLNKMIMEYLYFVNVENDASFHAETTPNRIIIEIYIEELTLSKTNGFIIFDLDFLGSMIYQNIMEIIKLEYEKIDFEEIRVFNP